MASPDTNLAERSGNLVESFKSYDPRILLFYAIIAVALTTLVGGLGYQQLTKVDEYADRARVQNQRRIVYPGPRGNILDRNGAVLVSNRPRFSVRLLLDQVRGEVRRERTIIRNNYRKVDDHNIPSIDQLEKIARVAVVQRYLDQVNRILGRTEKVDADRLHAHFRRVLLLPYTLLDDLAPGEYARLLERLPVNSPAQVYTSSTRYYPFGSAASHTLGYVGSDDDIESQNLPGDDLRTFKERGTVGRAGIEQRFDSELQGEAGGAIFRVDPNGNRLYPPLEQILPKQGKHIQLSLDIDLQLAAEQKITEYELAGAAVALDVATGEVLVLASKPDYDLSKFVPSLPAAVWADVIERNAAYSRAYQGTYPAGSPFKIITTIAGLRSGVIPLDGHVECFGSFRVGGRSIACNNHRDRGEITLPMAIEKSCNVFFTKYGMDMGPDIMASEARRFRLHQPTGLEIPAETRRMIIPDPEWKRRVRHEGWVGGDTANMSIGQGDVDVTPLQMACFAASLARNELWTQPSLLHKPGRPRQRTEPIGLTTQQRAVLLDGMQRVTKTGTARIFQDPRAGLTPLGIDVAGKTGTAQRMSPKGMLNIAWMIGFAPAEKPEIAFAVMIEGDTPGAETGGGRYAGPVAHAILRTWLEKKHRPAVQSVKFKGE